MKTITIYTNAACANSVSRTGPTDSTPSSPRACVYSRIILDGVEVLESEAIPYNRKGRETNGGDVLSCEYEAIASALESAKKFADEDTEINLFFATCGATAKPKTCESARRRRRRVGGASRRLAIGEIAKYKIRIKDACRSFARVSFYCASKDDPYINSCAWLCSQALALLEAKSVEKSFQNIVCTPIGFVQSPFLKKENCPKQGKFTEELSKINIFERYKDGLDGICEGDKVFVLCWFHESDRNILKVKPHGHKTGDMRGVFSTRAPVRPNPISLTLVTIVSVDDCVLTVKGLEALCGTPVLDIKPYYPDTDA